MDRGVYTVPGWVCDGIAGPLVLRRLTAGDWGWFLPRFQRMRAAEDRRGLLSRPIEGLTAAEIEADTARRAAIVAAQEAENAAVIELAERVCCEWVVTAAGRSGPEFWAEYQTRADVFASVLVAVWVEHTLSADQKKILRSGSALSSTSGAAMPGTGTAGDAPA